MPPEETETEAAESGGGAGERARTPAAGASEGGDAEIAATPGARETQGRAGELAHSRHGPRATRAEFHDSLEAGGGSETPHPGGAVGGLGSRGGPRGELRAAVVQDAATGRVLMLAWMDDEALRLTRESGEAHFFSRSRQHLWRKGETSGNTLAVEELREDCDGDAVLLRVRPNGPACHTGSVSCFAPWLWRTVA